jgi:hypothetical protein
MPDDQIVPKPEPGTGPLQPEEPVVVVEGLAVPIVLVEATSALEERAVEHGAEVKTGSRRHRPPAIPTGEDVARAEPRTVGIAACGQDISV